MNEFPSGIKGALEYAVNLSGPTFQIVDDKLFSDKPMQVVEYKTPMVTPISVCTLTSLVEYINRNADGSVDGKWIIHVASPTLVYVLTQAEADEWKRRATLIGASLEDVKPYPFGQFIQVEDFIIRLKTQFVPTEDITRLLAIVGNLKDEKVRNVSDDGVTQTVVAKVGITRVGEVDVPNEVRLYPYRTFLDIDQPPVLCTFRMKSGIKEGDLPTCALFEADGGMWKLMATQSIKQFIEGGLKDGHNHVILA